MVRYYDRQGAEISLEEWCRLGSDPEYKVLKQTTLERVWVSTVWLGLNHNFGDGPPLFFETMVFENDGSMIDLDCNRYSTEEDAIWGHDEMVGKWESCQHHEGVELSE